MNKPEAYIRRDITDDPGTLSNGVPPKVQFMLLCLAHRRDFDWSDWWDVGYSRPPLRHPQQ